MQQDNPTQDQTTTPPASTSDNNGLARFRAKYPGKYDDIPDDKLADAIYNKFYANKISRTSYDQQMGLIGTPREKPPTEAESPSTDVGGGLFTFASHMAKPVVDTAAGLVQHGGDLLSAMGIPIDPKAAENVANNIRSGYSRFASRSQEYYKTSDEEHPNISTAGDIAGELFLYGATGPAFTEGVLGKAVLKFGPVLGRAIQGAVQAGTLEGIKSEEPGAKAFQSALGGAFGGAAGGALGGAVGMVGNKVGNALALRSLRNELSNISKGWDSDTRQLTSAFQSKMQAVETRTKTLQTQYDNALTKAGIILKKGEDLPSNAPKYVKDAKKALEKYGKSTEFLDSKVFSKVKEATGVGGAGSTFYEANEQLMKNIISGDKEKAERVWNAFSPRERILLQKGIAYRALQEASKDGVIEPKALEKALDKSGLDIFFPGDSRRILDGFKEMVVQSAEHKTFSNIFALSHLAGGFGFASLGGYRGYKQEGPEGALLGSIAGFLAYVSLYKMINTGMSSQVGRDLLTAASHTTAGTPRAARIFDRLIGISSIAAGGRTYSDTLETINNSIEPSQ